MTFSEGTLEPSNAEANIFQSTMMQGEMVIRTLSTTILQILCKIFSNSKVIVKSITGQDDIFWKNS